MKLFNVLLSGLVLCLMSVTVNAKTQGLLSVHVLDQQTGQPAAGVVVTLEQKQENTWHLLNQATTDRDGRINALWPDSPAQTGEYRVVFKTGAYFNAQQKASFFPEVPVIFQIDNIEEHYHVPLLLSAYGYSTYRGS